MSFAIRLGALALAATLTACSQAPADRNADRVGFDPSAASEAAAAGNPADRVMASSEVPTPILDANGEPLDPETAAEVRAELDRQQAERGGSDGGYSDGGAEPADDSADDSAVDEG